MVSYSNSNQHLLLLIILLITFLFKQVITEFPKDYLKIYYPKPTDIISTTFKTTTISESQDIGNCTCNLLQNLCDYHCCCDTDCASDLIATWKSALLCKDKDNRRMKNYLCDNENSTYFYNNNQSGLVYRDQVSNLLCVTWDNSRDMGEFYLDPTAVPLDDLKLNLTNQYDNWWKKYYTPYGDGTVGSGGYAYGDQIKVILKDTYVNDSLYLYQPDAFGNCRWNNVVRFNVSNKKVSCSYNAQTKVSFLDTLLNIEINNGANNIVKMSTKLTAYKNTAGTLIISSLTAFTNDDYVESLKIRFYINNNVIERIETTLVYVTLLAADKFPIKQTYETQWFTDTLTGLEFKSGNPGYFYKKPVRFYKVISASASATAFTINENGVYIRGRDLDGKCIQTSAITGNYNRNDEPILFGVDSVYFCSITKSATPITATNFLISKNEDNINNIGRFGSSNPGFTQDWNKTEIGPATATFTGDRTIVFQILTSKFGPKSKPQLYILGAKLITIDEPLKDPVLHTIRFITKFISVSYDQFLKSEKEISLLPFPNTINKNIP